jgi:drug/metabolite transporter (DMT)-like permease
MIATGMLGAIYALAASACWVIAPFISIIPIRAVGSVRYARVRMAVASLFLAAIVLLTGSWNGMTQSAVALLVLSGLTGILLGDVIFFRSVSILGVRRANLLFLLSVPFTVVIAQTVLGERLTYYQSIGALLVFFGISLGVMKGGRASATVEQVQGSFWVGVGAALLAAFLQAMGIVIAKPVFVDEIDALAAATVRTTAAAAVIFGITVLTGRIKDYILPREILTPSVVSSIVSTAGGSTFVMLSLAHTSASVTSILSSVAPILMLPVLHFVYKETVAWQAWIGALLAVGGVWTIFLEH